MADLPESKDWISGLYQLETSDPVLGGPEGISNRQATQLGSRTQWLKKKIETLIAKFEQATETVMGIARIATQSTVKTGTDDRTMVTPKKLAALFPFRGIAVYSTPGVHTWTVPSGVGKVWVTVIGAGGGGARLDSLPGPSGGSGGGIAKRLIDLAGIKSVTVTVGLGGTGGLVDGAVGTNGSTSSFGTRLWATGGVGGYITGQGPSGGHGVNGDENSTLGYGGLSVRNANGTNFLGGAGGGGSSTFAGLGDQKPRAPGHGGGGRNGGPAPNGADGQVTIQW